MFLGVTDRLHCCTFLVTCINMAATGYLRVFCTNCTCSLCDVQILLHVSCTNMLSFLLECCLVLSFAVVQTILSVHTNGVTQKRRNSIAHAMELRLFCIKPSIHSLCEIMWTRSRWHQNAHFQEIFTANRKSMHSNRFPGICFSIDFGR